MSVKTYLASIASTVITGATLAHAQPTPSRQAEPEPTPQIQTTISSNVLESMTHEKTNIQNKVKWQVRKPLSGGRILRQDVDLDTALKNPDLKNNIYVSKPLSGPSPLKMAVMNNDMELLDKCLASGVNPNIGFYQTGNADEDEARSPLAQAINNYTLLRRNGYTTDIQKEQIKKLLNAGANPNISLISGERETPLHAMAKIRDSEMIKLLIQKGADVSIKNQGKTPLDVYQSDIYEAYGDKPVSWRNEKNEKTIQSLTPKGFLNFNLFDKKSR